MAQSAVTVILGEVLTPYVQIMNRVKSTVLPHQTASCLARLAV